MAKNKNSKNKIIIVVVILILLAVAAFFFLNKNKMAGPNLAGSNNAITSIQDALTKSISLQCEFTDEGGRKTKSYIKNGAVRADITSGNADESGSTIIKDKTVYFWNSKGGFMMTMPDVKTDDTVKSEGSGSEESQGADVIKAMEQFKDSCKTAVVSDSLFIPPSDIKFTDMSKMMPTGTTQTGGQAPQMNQEQINQYMQQYQNPSQ